MGNELIVSVQNRIQEMQHGEGLRLPTGYSVGNALNSAYLILSDNSKGKSLLEKCHPTSVSKALLNMAIQGLSQQRINATLFLRGSMYIDEIILRISKHIGTTF